MRPNQVMAFDSVYAGDHCDDWTFFCCMRKSGEAACLVIRKLNLHTGFPGLEDRVSNQIGRCYSIMQRTAILVPTHLFHAVDPARSLRAEQLHCAISIWKRGEIA